VRGCGGTGSPHHSTVTRPASRRRHFRQIPGILPLDLRGLCADRLVEGGGIPFVTSSPPPRTTAPHPAVRQNAEGIMQRLFVGLRALALVVAGGLLLASVALAS